MSQLSILKLRLTVNDVTRNLAGEKYSLSFNVLTILKVLFCSLNWDLSLANKLELRQLPASLEDLVLYGECLIVHPNEAWL